jgi:hypothetical protein
MRRYRSSPRHDALVVLSALAATSVSASASASTVCGSTNAGWNAPAGAAVFEIAPGNIGDVLRALGEQRSHSMLSHGPDTWVTHATSITPPVVQDCDNPVSKSFMGAATPGLATVNQGAIYTFLYGDGAPPYKANGQDELYYQNAANSNSGWNNLLATQWLMSDEWGDVFSWNPMNVYGQTVWGINFQYNNGSVQSPSLFPAGQIYYGWYQYMQVGSTPNGYPPAQTGGAGLNKGYGVTCSSSLAMQQHDALWSQPNYRGFRVGRSAHAVVVA